MLFDLADAIGLVADNNALDHSNTSDFSDSGSDNPRPLISTVSDNSTNPIRISSNNKNTNENATNKELLPQHYYKADNLTFWNKPKSAVAQLRLKYGDSQWIKAKLNRLPTNKRQLVIEEYSKRYNLVFESEPSDIKKEGRARFVANTWLLKKTT